MTELLFELRKLQSEVKIWQTRHSGMSAAADHFCAQFLQERRRLRKAQKALTEIVNNEPWLHAIDADYVVNTAKRAIEDLE